MTIEPLVSVVILNYKRLAELARSLESAVRQDWPNLEILVVDNHSEEDVASVVRAAGGPVRLLELPENRGSCAGRNAGIREAKGEIVVTIDNDVSFVSPFEIRKVVATFADRSDIQVLAFRICDAGTGKLRIREWCHPRDWRTFHDIEFETTFFGEGASAFRREVFESAGLYWEPLFIGHEGYDLAIRILNHGFRILYCPRVAVAHSMSAEARPQDRPFYIYTRNYVWIARKDHSVLQGLMYAAPKLLMMLAFSLRARRMLPFLRGLSDGVWKFPQSAARTRITKAGLSRFRQIESTRPGLARRILRHRLEPQL